MSGSTLRVAERIMISAQRDMWALADAVLADAPEISGRTPVDGSYVAVQTKLATIVHELHEAGITKADGTPYQPGYLTELRKAAMTWDPDDRQAEASFEAHRENGGDERRAVLIALCRHARGETVDELPAGVTLENWRAALDKLSTRRHGFKVQTQAVRIALGIGGKNAPTKLDQATFAELLTHLSTSIDGLATFVERLDGAELGDDDRARMLRVLVRLRDRTAMTIDMLSVSLTDEQLGALIDSEATS